MKEQTNAVTSELKDISRVRVKCSEFDPSILRDKIANSGLTPIFTDEEHGLRSGPNKGYLLKKQETQVIKGTKS